MSNQEPLRDALRHRADRLGDTSPLTLDDVKGRARGIRRRQAAVTGLAAAAVLAVAVPVGIAVTDRVGTDPDNPPVAGPSATPSQDGTSSPSPTGPRRVVLTTEVSETSDAPAIPYLYDGGIMQGEYLLMVGKDYDSFAPVDLGWVATRRDDEGNSSVDFLDADGNVTGSEPSTGSLAVSRDGTVVAYATPDGELMTVTPDAEPMSLVDPEALPDGILEPVAVVGSDSCLENAEGGGCAVFFNSDDVEKQAAYSVTSKGIVSPLLLSVNGLSPDGSLSGVTSIDQNAGGSCSVVLAPDGEEAWETCDHMLGQFSPDGRYVIGHPAYQSGIGDASVAILDARTGELMAEFQNSEEHQSFINDVVWDSDNTLLATVFEEGSWSLMRMTPAGELSTVLADLGDDMDEVPLQLSTQP